MAGLVSKLGLLAVSNRQVALLPLVARILSDQGVVLLFLGVVVAVQLRHGDVRQLLSLLVFYFVLSRRLLPLISQISFTAGQVESTCENVRHCRFRTDQVPSAANACAGDPTPGCGFRPGT